MESFLRNLRILLRAEVLLAEIRLKIASRRIALVAFAGLIAVFALFMLNVAGFFALEPSWGRVWAAIFVAAIDCVIAGILILAARGLRPGPEAEMAQEMRQIALDEIEADAKALQKEVGELRDEIQGVRDAVMAFVRNPLDAMGMGLIIPLITALTKMVRSAKKEEPSDGE